MLMPRGTALSCGGEAMTDEPVYANHDRLSDVLYLSRGAPDRRARSEEEPWGVVWRISSDGVCRGVMIRNVSTFRNGKRTKLIDMLAARLDLPRATVRKNIPELVA
jgi:hypothetical protein